MTALRDFQELASQKRFQGWPLAGEPKLGEKIPWFGQMLHYQLETGNGVEEYTSIIRHFGWVVTFGLNQRREVITTCQWKPGVNQASWELPPGGIGKIAPDASLLEITQKTQEVYMGETGYGCGTWDYLGHIMIETGKYRGAGPDDHGLKAHMFLATNLQYVRSARAPGANEIMETLLVPIEEFKEVLASGLFVEASAVPCA